MSPLQHPLPHAHAHWRALLLHPARHWPLYALAGTACLLLACILAEALTHPEALALALFLFTGVLADALLAPGGTGRWLPMAMAIAGHAAAVLWSLALAGSALHLLVPRHALLAQPLRPHPPVAHSLSRRALIR